MLLQGRQKLLCNLYEAVKGFVGKLSLFKVHAESGNFLHFRFTIEVCGEEVARTEDAKQVLVGVWTACRSPSTNDWQGLCVYDF